MTSWLLSQENENHVQLFVDACSRLGVSHDMCWLAMPHVAKVLVLLALPHYYWYTMTTAHTAANEMLLSCCRRPQGKVQTMLDRCWHDAGKMLEPCWNDAGTMLAETMLERCWNNAGMMLEDAGMMLGAMLERCLNDAAMKMLERS